MEKNEEIIELIDDYLSGNKEVFTKILDYESGLIGSVINNFLDFGLEFEDLYQEGIIGLLEAAKRYNSNYNSTFNDYAYFWIKKYVNEFAMKCGRKIRVPSHIYVKLINYKKVYYILFKKIGREPTIEELSKELNVDSKILYNYIFPDESFVGLNYASEYEKVTDIIDDAFEALENEMDIKILINKLNFTQKELFIIYHRYGFIDGKVYTFAEIGKMLKLSGEAVRKTEKRCLVKMKEYACNNENILTDFDASLSDLKNNSIEEKPAKMLLRK